jgi:serine/threonine protein kinase/WD40 repeat protein
MKSIKEIFLAACKLAPDQRQEFVEQACDRDLQRMDQVQRLLGAHVLENHPIDESIFAELPTLDFPKPGEELGPYLLTKEIGEGGFGVVFEAEQLKPFQRRVAIKVIKSGMDTRQYLRRFDDERRALAMLNHPHIAALFDGGSTQSGRPYFVMELVEGQKITDYCKSNLLPIDERLLLFLSVGEAIEHAHQRGVIHRDLKPSNILVTNITRKVSVKIIDFGIAKLIGSSFQNDQKTAVGDFLGTPMYTSPEQARGGSIDTRSDIYSLGMVLYELITGLPPHDPQLIKRSSQAKALEYVSQITPKRPSLRLVEDKSESLVANDKRLKNRPIHELDAIVMKAIAQKPDERYSSIGEFLADIRRYLTHQPVLAKSQSAGYVMRKFIARHKLFASVIAFTISLISLVALGSVLFNIQLKELLNRAQTAETALERSNREVTLQAQTALLNLARSHASSRSAGQHFECLDALQASLRLAPQIDERLDEFRTVAASALVLPDLRTRTLFDLPVATLREFTISEDLKLIGYFDEKANQFCIYDLQRQSTVMRVEDGKWNFGKFDYFGPSFSPDSRYLVYTKAIDDEPRLAIWRVGEDEPSLELDSSASLVNFRDDMKCCAVSYRDGTIRFLNIPDWTELGRISTQTNEPYLDWNAQGSLFYTWEKNRVLVFDAHTQQEIAEVHSDKFPFEWHTWHPSGEKIATVTGNGELFLWDARTGKLQETIQQSDKNQGHIIQFSRSGRYLALNSWQDYLQIFDMQTRQAVLQTNARGVLIKFGQADSIFVGDVQPNQVSSFDFHAVKNVDVILDPTQQPFPVGNCSVTLDPSGRWLLIPGNDGLTFIDTHNNRTAFEMPIPGNRPVGWFSSENFFVTIGSDGIIRWPVDNSMANTIRIGPPKQLLAQEAIGIWSADKSGNLVAGGVNANCAVLIDQRENSIRRLVYGDVRAASVSPSGAWVATGTHGAPSETRIWQRENSQLKETFKLSLGSLLGFSHDEKWFTSNEDGMRMWEIGKWDDSFKLTDERPPFFCMSADSTILAIATTTNQLELRSLPLGKQLLTLTSPDSSRLMPLVFSYDNQRLFAIGRDTGYVYSFDLRAIEAELGKLRLGKPTPWSQESSQNAPATTDHENSHSYQSVKFDVDLGDYPLWQKSWEPYRKANQAFGEGKIADAIAFYREAALLHPGRCEIENNLAWILAIYGTTTEEREEAVEHARQATNTSPFISNHWNTLACACFQAGMFEECLTAIQRSMAEKPTPPDLYDRLIETVALHETGQPDSAVAKWNELTKSPQFAELKNNDKEFAILSERAREFLDPVTKDKPD